MSMSSSSRNFLHTPKKKFEFFFFEKIKKSTNNYKKIKKKCDKTIVRGCEKSTDKTSLSLSLCLSLSPVSHDSCRYSYLLKCFIVFHYLLYTKYSSRKNKDNGNECFVVFQYLRYTIKNRRKNK